MTKILLIGKSGQVGWELQHALRPLGQVIALDRSQMDLTDAKSIRKSIRDSTPNIIVNAAAYTSVDKAESEPERAMQINAVAPGIMAEEAKQTGALLVHYSTDYVFDGSQSAPYTEDDLPNPLNMYGKSKLAGEVEISASNCAHLILRTSWLYSARNENFVLTMLRLARDRKELAVVNDQIGSPTWASTLAEVTADIIDKTTHHDFKSGIYHVSADGFVSRFDFARKIISIAQEELGGAENWATITPTLTKDYPLPAARPLNAATDKDKIKRAFEINLTNWEDQLRACLKDLFNKPTPAPI